VSVATEDDVPKDLAILPAMCPFNIDPERFGIDPVEIEKGGNIIGRFGKSLSFDLENAIEVSKGETPNHWPFFVPAMMEAMPKVRPVEVTFSNPAPLARSRYISGDWK